MPRVRVHLLFHVRRLLGEKYVEIEADNVKDAILTLIDWTTKIAEGEEKAVQLRRILLKQSDLTIAREQNIELELQAGYKILVNGRNINLLKGLETPLQEGDELAILPAVAGG